MFDEIISVLKPFYDTILYFENSNAEIFDVTSYIVYILKSLDSQKGL